MTEQEFVVTRPSQLELSIHFHAILFQQSETSALTVRDPMAICQASNQVRYQTPQLCFDDIEGDDNFVSGTQGIWGASVAHSVSDREISHCLSLKMFKLQMSTYI